MVYRFTESSLKSRRTKPLRIVTRFWAISWSFSRHEFEKIRREVQPKVHLHAFSAWTQCVARLSGQLVGQDRPVRYRGCPHTPALQVYHLGMGSVSRASLARANERTSADLFDRAFAASCTLPEGCAACHEKVPFCEGNYNDLA